MTLSLSPIVLSAPPNGARVFAGTSEDFYDLLHAALWKDAFAQGELQGRAAAGEELADSTAALVAAAEEAAERASRDLAARTALLVTAICEQILRTELDRGRYDIEAMVRETLAAASTGRVPCTIRVSPEDAQRLSSVPFRAGTVVEGDPDLPTGHVQVESAKGLAVRDIDEIVRRLRVALRELGE